MSSSKNSIRAGIVDNALVVSFMAADAPRVWRADMGQLLTAALEVQDNQGKSTLVMKRSGAPAEEIVTFSSKKDAIDALQVITEVLLQGTGQGTGQATGACTASQPQKSCGWFKKILKFILGIVVAFCVFIVVMNLFFHVAGIHPPSHQAGPAKAPASAPTGVPTPADSIIGK
jgi:hypothetical protein